LAMADSAKRPIERIVAAKPLVSMERASLAIMTNCFSVNRNLSPVSVRVGDNYSSMLLYVELPLVGGQRPVTTGRQLIPRDVWGDRLTCQTARRRWLGEDRHGNRGGRSPRNGGHTVAMRKRLTTLVKYVLTALGSRLPEPFLGQVDVAVKYAKLGKWMAVHEFDVEQRVRDRDAVFDVMAQRVRDRNVLYLEFGVYQGESMRYWSRALCNPESHLHGFDSFEGLPEDFDGHLVKGYFSTRGVVPQIDDPRVRFFKGWFEELLPTYTPPDHDVLVVNMDADLYSSTATAFRFLGRWIRPGSLLYFDEMSRIEHEPKAFIEFARGSGRRFKPLCADKSLDKVCFGFIRVFRG
jgi:Methyltransferase domain